MSRAALASYWPRKSLGDLMSVRSAATSLASRHELSSPPRQSRSAAMSSHRQSAARPAARVPRDAENGTLVGESHARRRTALPTLSKKTQRSAPQLAPPAKGSGRPSLGVADFAEFRIQNPELRQTRLWVRFSSQIGRIQNSEFREQACSALNSAAQKRNSSQHFRIQRRFYNRAEFRVRRRGAAEFKAEFFRSQAANRIQSSRCAPPGAQENSNHRIQTRLLGF